MSQDKGAFGVVVWAATALLGAGLTCFLLCSARPSRVAAEPPSRAHMYPDLIVRERSRALGKLRFDPERQKYALAGRFVSLIVEPTELRAARVGEPGGGGPRGNGTPAWATPLGDRLIAFVPEFNRVVALDAGLNVVAQAGFGAFRFEGTIRNKPIAASRGALYLFHENTLFAYGDKLDKLGDLVLDRFGWAPNDFVVQAGRLYTLGANGPVVECRGPCAPSRISITVVDVSDPRAMKLVRDERVVYEGPPFNDTWKALDAAGQAWVVPSELTNKPTMQLRTLAAPGKLAAAVELPGEVVAMTERAPIYAVVERDGKRTLISILTSPTTIAVGGQRALELSRSRLALRSDGHHVFVVSGAELRVFAADPAMTPELKQVIVTADHEPAELDGVFLGE